MDPSRLTLSWNGTAVLVAGSPQHAEPDVNGGRAEIALDLGLGDAAASYLTSDLSYEYVRINAEYRS